MTEGMEETPGRHCCELLQALHDRHLAIADTDAPNEDIETRGDERGIKGGELGDCDEVVQG